jgi:hypothetical protein
MVIACGEKSSKMLPWLISLAAAVVSETHMPLPKKCVSFSVSGTPLRSAFAATASLLTTLKSEYNRRRQDDSSASCKMRVAECPPSLADMPGHKLRNTPAPD